MQMRIDREAVIPQVRVDRVRLQGQEITNDL
jgi:hypothetical protein